MQGPRVGSRAAIVGLVLANLVPLVGVVRFGWDFRTLVTIYWLEFAVIIVKSVAKVRRAEGEDSPEDVSDIIVEDESEDSMIGKPKRQIVKGTVGFYGLWWLISGIFVLFVFFRGITASVVDVAVGLAGVVAYHGSSYWGNYLRQGGYQNTGPVAAFAEPLRYFFVLFVTIVLGGFGWFSLVVMGIAKGEEALVGPLVIMIVAKTALDLREYRREHDLDWSSWPWATASE